MVEWSAYAFFAFARAFDISLINSETGERYQPNQNVQVSIKLLGEALADGDAVNVVHFADSHAENPVRANAESAEVIEAAVVDGAVAFESQGFSVYVVSKDQRGFIFKFMSPEHAEYTQLRQTVFDGDVLVKPVAPSEFGRVFDKWEWKGMEGTDADFSDFSYTYVSAASTPFLDSEGKMGQPISRQLITLPT